MQWAEQQCRKEQHATANEEQHVTANDEQLRKVLGDLIYLIRFPTMKRKYFTNKVSIKNVLTLEEKLEIYQSFDGKVIDTFPTNIRLSNSTLNIWRCKSYLNEHISWNQDGADDCLDFTTNVKNIMGKYYYPINLAKPLRISKNIRYTIKLNMKGNNCFYGKDLQSVVNIYDDLSVTFTDSSSSLNGTSSTGGQIPGIILSQPYFR